MALLSFAFECCGDQVHVVVEELDVVGGFLHPSNRRGQDDDLAAGLPGHRLRRLEVEVGFHQDDRDLELLHLADQVDGVLG